jgi:hypothetical protein
MASATPRRAGPKIISSSAWLPGIIGPDTAPCSTRNASSDGRLQDSPQSSEASVKASTDSTKVRTTPKRCMSQPVSGTETPLETANEVMTQVPWSELTPRSPAIVGIETLAMLVSSTCMKVPSASASAVMPMALPCSGAGALTARRPPWRRSSRQ